MRIYADLHIHSRFSRATSKQLNLENLEKYGRIKGLNLIGTGDFTHPEWIKEIKETLREDGTGILKSKSGFNFVLSSEVSLMYTQGGKARKVHLVLLAPSLEIVDKITAYFKSLGRIDYDGRPIFGKSIIEVTRKLKEISDKIEIIPAHIWTPWFGVLGSKSGFDSIKEAFGDEEKHIYAIEMGLSSNPKMNWMLSELDKYTLIANSDSHSFWPWRLGRECNIFDFEEITYDNLIKAIRTREGYVGTIGVDPNYGKYHYDGHRNCGFSCTPEKAKELNYLCPVCKRPLTLGVMHRVKKLADRNFGFVLREKEEHHNFLPLSEVVCKVFGNGVATRKTMEAYNKLVEGTNEYFVLLEMEKADIEKRSSKDIAEMVIKNRKEDFKIKPGYDGEYGVLEYENAEKEKSRNIFEVKKQPSLLDF